MSLINWQVIISIHYEHNQKVKTSMNNFFLILLYLLLFNYLRFNTLYAPQNIYKFLF